MLATVLALLCLLHLSAAALSSGVVSAAILFPAGIPVTVLSLAGAQVAPVVAAASGKTEVAPDVDVPQRARDVLAEIEKRRGEPPPGHVGGRAFQNRERRLPRGSYREYDVNARVRGRNRGAERIVIERKSGRAYYTRDHYETFVPMN